MEDILLIDKYINKELSDSEIEQFEERLKTDEAFAEEYNSVLSLTQGIRLSSLQDKLELLNKVEAEKPLKKKIVRIRKIQDSRIFRLSIAASIVILLSIGLWTILNPRSIAHQEIFAANFEPDNHLFANPTRGDNTRQNCYQNYTDQLWDEAISCLAKLLVDEDLNIDNYYLGIAYMANNMPGEAITALRLAAPMEGVLSAEELNWYRGLAFIQANQINEAIELLTSIKGGDYFEKAQVLLEDLDKISDSQ